MVHTHLARQLKRLAYGHVVSMWPSWELNTGSPESKPGTLPVRPLHIPTLLLTQEQLFQPVQLSQCE